MSRETESTPPRDRSIAALLPIDIAKAPRISHARFSIGDIVRHTVFGFRGVVFDIDPAFANSEDWYAAIPEAMRPRRDQPFYHLLAENGDASYVAYVSQQHLAEDSESGPIDHPAVGDLFSQRPEGSYRMDDRRWH